MGDPTPTPVWCIDCGRQVHTPVSRARRIGAGCWRARQAAARAAARPVALPGMSGHGGRAAGPTPGQEPLDGIDGVDDVAQDRERAR